MSGGIYSFKYTSYKEFVKWDDKIFAPINNRNLSLACAVCLHITASQNDVTFAQNLEHTGDIHTLAELGNTVVRSIALRRHTGVLMRMETEMENL